MTQTINLAMAEGSRSAELFATFNANIAGQDFTFGIHRSLSETQGPKISEFSTGMGIAMVQAPFEPKAECGFLIQSANDALKALIEAKGEQAVVNILVGNRAARPTLNQVMASY